MNKKLNETNWLVAFLSVMGGATCQVAEGCTFVMLSALSCQSPMLAMFEFRERDRSISICVYLQFIILCIELFI